LPIDSSAEAFPEANVVHLGDTFWNGIYPFIDYSTGGNIDGIIGPAQCPRARLTSAPEHSEEAAAFLRAAGAVRSTERAGCR
jgi:hypothetical protein